ncbi:MAG: RagB/SusD family nutrient uptake outer membrane protein [Prevotella sp.]|nr:RagB/SusD family nutrient uptake outer membrane protein [Prevotella sp.]
MITKNIKTLLIAGIGCCGVAAAFTSCDDLFEPALENNKDITQMYTDPQFARGLLDNAYLILPYDGSPSTDVATDDAVSNDNDNDYKKMATGSWASNMNPVSQWDARYHAIQYCNIMIENGDKVEWDYSSTSLNEMHKDNFLGNAYALRGLHFFYLLRAHCGKVNGELMGVPIHLASEDGSSDFNLPRNTFRECIDQIMADFDEALKYLPEQYGDVDAANVPAKYKQMGGDDSEYNRAFGNMQRGKIDGRIIAAFKAQVALFAASPAYASASGITYEQAAQYAVASLRNCGGVAGMSQDGWKWFATAEVDNLGATDPNPAEIVWRGNVDESNSLETNNYPPSLYGNGRVNPTQNLVDAFPMANGYPITVGASGYDAANPYENRDPRLKQYILVNGETQGAAGAVINTAADANTLDGINRENGRSTKTGYYLRKLMRSNLNLDPSSSTTGKHLPARIRYTEIFLDYAEAANEAQGPTATVGGANYSAYDVIKALHDRAGVGNEYLESIKNDKDKMRELIRNERRLELCFENHRFWDLRRWQANLNETAKGVNITTNANGTLNYSNTDVETRDYKDYMIYGPIPYTEVLKWSNLLQNDGWK